MKILSDAWHHRALGKSAESVWIILLANGSMTAKEVAEQTGRHVNTVQRALNKLWMYGLAIPDGGGMWVAEPAGEDYLQDVAEEMGTKGKAEQRKIKHSQERSIWATQQLLRQKEQWVSRHERRDVTIDGLCAVCRSKRRRVYDAYHRETLTFFDEKSQK